MTAAYGKTPGLKLRKAATILVAGCQIACTPLLGRAAVCFTAQDNAKLTFVVIQQAPPPLPGNEAEYANYPFTTNATMQIGRIGQGPNAANEYYVQWANRSNVPVTTASGRQLVERKTNLQPRTLGGRSLRSRFSSFERANLCTTAQTATALNQPMAPFEERARAIGVTLKSESAVADIGDTAPDDLCVLPARTLAPGAAGIMLDYEVQDGRTPAQTEAFLTDYANMVHRAGKKVGLLLNPLDAPTQPWTGMDRSNAAKMARLYDWSTIFLSSFNRQHDIVASFNSQMAILKAGGGVDPKRLVVNFELANTSLQDAAKVRSLIANNRLLGVMFWRNGAKQGGDCQEPVNLKIACIAFGRCSP